MKITVHIARWALSGVFLWAGVAKAIDPASFLTDIESFQLLPYRWAWLLSIWLPWLEITCALALLWGRAWTGAASALVATLLLAFTVAVVSAWARGLNLSCGCFGHDDEPAHYPWLLTRDAALLGLAGFIFLTTKHTKGTKSS